jgi:hypothetical protein
MATTCAGLARGYPHESKVKSRQGIEAAAWQGRHAGAPLCTDTASARSPTRTRIRPGR